MSGSDRSDAITVGTLGGTRTPNPLVRSQVLCPLSYEGKNAITDRNQESIAVMLGCGSISARSIAIASDSSVGLSKTQSLSLEIH